MVYKLSGNPFKQDRHHIDGITMTSAISIEKMRSDARSMFSAGLASVKPDAAIERFCRRTGDTLSCGKHQYDLSQIQRIFIVGAGKASAPMAAALERMLGQAVAGGVVNVKYGHTAALNRVQLVEAGHPVPDLNGVMGTQAMIDICRGAGAQDLVIGVISGGGSALSPLPAPPLTLQDKQHTSQVLLDSGANIHEINAIRKHISAVKGGRLAQAAYPSPMLNLILSDVVGDDLDVIASGPAVPDRSTFGDCMRIINKYNLKGKLPAAVLNRIEGGLRGEVEETPKAGTHFFRSTVNVVVGSNFEAVLAAKEKAVLLGYNTIILSSLMVGETREIALAHTAIAKEIRHSGNPAPVPACIISGGETTVTIRGSGLGGRNQEFALAALAEIDGLKNTVILSAGTDGNDGPTDAAGAIVDHQTAQRARDLGIDPDVYLADNDAYHFFESLSDLFITGPTNTNVMDLRIMLVT